MPTKRTPPHTRTLRDLNDSTTLTRAKSDQDIPGPSVTTPTASNSEISLVTLRTKRPRTEASPPPTTLEDFKAEMRVMMTSLISEQSAMLYRLAEDVSAIKTQNNTIQKSNEEIVMSIDSIKKSCAKLGDRLDKLEMDRNDCRNGLLNLEKRVSSMELSSRTSSVEIRNIPATENETSSDLYNLVSATGRALNIEIHKSQIRDVYRLPSKPGKNQPIIAEFCTVPMKMDLLNSARIHNKNRSAAEKLNTEMIGLKGKSSPIYVSEFLPGATRKLFYLAREFARTSDYKFCWAVNGKIYLRKSENSSAIRVESEEALRGLTNDK